MLVLVGIPLFLSQPLLSCSSSAWLALRSAVAAPNRLIPIKDKEAALFRVRLSCCYVMSCGLRHYQTA